MPKEPKKKLPSSDTYYLGNFKISRVKLLEGDEVSLSKYIDYYVPFEIGSYFLIEDNLGFYNSEFSLLVVKTMIEVTDKFIIVKFDVINEEKNTPSLMEVISHFYLRDVGMYSLSEEQEAGGKYKKVKKLSVVKKAIDETFYGAIPVTIEEIKPAKFYWDKKDSFKEFLTGMDITVSVTKAVDLDHFLESDEHLTVESSFTYKGMF
jgi:hypothetical protein